MDPLDQALMGRSQGGVCGKVSALHLLPEWQRGVWTSDHFLMLVYPWEGVGKSLQSLFLDFLFVPICWGWWPGESNGKESHRGNLTRTPTKEVRLLVTIMSFTQHQISWSVVMSQRMMDLIGVFNTGLMEWVGRILLGVVGVLSWECEIRGGLRCRVRGTRCCWRWRSAGFYRFLCSDWYWKST